MQSCGFSFWTWLLLHATCWSLPYVYVFKKRGEAERAGCGEDVFSQLDVHCMSELSSFQQKPLVDGPVSFQIFKTCRTSQPMNFHILLFYNHKPPCIFQSFCYDKQISEVERSGSLIKSILCVSALNRRRRPWYDPLLSCPPPLLPRWTQKCPIRVNLGARAANHSPPPVTPKLWVPKGLKTCRGEWG